MKKQFSFKELTAFGLIIFLQASAFATFDLSDVSYLLPLPKTINENQLRPILSVVDAKYLEQLPRLSMLIPSKDLFQKMYAISIRLEPQEKQIRIVWQPIVVGPQFSSTTLDMAYHSFHQLDEAQLKDLIEDLKQWKIHFNKSFLPQNLLGIHPTLKTNPNALIKLQDLFFKYCKPTNLVKITAMVLRGNEDMWAFTGLNIKTGGDISFLEIARTPKQRAQAYVNGAVPFDRFDFIQLTGISYDTKDSFLSFLSKAKDKVELSEEDIRSSIEIANRIENPKVYHEDQMDCVHCHISQSVKAYLQTHFSNLRTASGEYTNPTYNLNNNTTEFLNTRQIRGFGYFGSNVAISQRAVNASAEAADWINAYLNKKRE